MLGKTPEPVLLSYLVLGSVYLQWEVYLIYCQVYTIKLQKF